MTQEKLLHFNCGDPPKYQLLTQRWSDHFSFEAKHLAHNGKVRGTKPDKGIRSFTLITSYNIRQLDGPTIHIHHFKIGAKWTNTVTTNSTHHHAIVTDHYFGMVPDLRSAI